MSAADPHKKSMNLHCRSRHSRFTAQTTASGMRLNGLDKLYSWRDRPCQVDALDDVDCIFAIHSGRVPRQHWRNESARMNDNPCFPRLFSSLKVGERTLRNRVALSATLTNYGAGHRVTDRWTNFLAERAKGGCAAIITEVIAVDPAALSIHGAIVAGYDEKNEEDFKRTAEVVEGAGACLIAQLWHPGRQQLWSPVWSPKGISGPTGRL